MTPGDEITIVMGQTPGEDSNHGNGSGQSDST